MTMIKVFAMRWPTGRHEPQGRQHKAPASIVVRPSREARWRFSFYLKVRKIVRPWPCIPQASRYYERDGVCRYVLY